MNALHHPSVSLTGEQISTIRANAPIAENNGWLTSGLLNIIYDQQWFKLLAPHSYGGLQMDLPAAVRLEESLAWADGSLGWVVTLCAGAGWFGGFIDAPLSARLFAGHRVCIAGSGAVSGIAVEVDGGYIVNGLWQYASGAPAATAFTANVAISGSNGKVLPFVFLRDEIEIIETWNAMGMVATASHSFQVRDLFVPAERAFIIGTGSAVINEPLYHYPFLQLAELTLAANISGMTIRFIDLCDHLFTHKTGRDGHLLIKDHLVGSRLSVAKEEIDLVRSEFYSMLQQSWDECCSLGKIDDTVLKRVSHLAHHLALAGRRQAQQLFPFCGLSATNKSSEINQVWRDIITAAQHPLLVFPSTG